MSKPRENFHFKPPVEVKEDWMIGLTSLDVYNSFFNITEEKKTNLNSINFLMKRLVAFHTQKSKMMLKKTWEFQILQQQIHKMI